MRSKLVIIILLSFLLGAAGGLLLHVSGIWGGGSSIPRAKTSGTVLIGGPFTMLNTDGETVTHETFAGRFTLVFFGFTNCPDVCPASLQVAGEALEKRGPLAKKVVPIFVSVDPARDTPGVLKVYLGNFDSRITGLTGSEGQMREMVKAYRVYVNAGEPDSDGYYAVDHSTFMYLMGPDGRYAAHFPYGIQGDALADRIRPLLQQG
ncbi:MAG: SCO family protein [Hyphomicrobiaceae bacterium]